MPRAGQAFRSRSPLQAASVACSRARSTQPKTVFQVAARHPETMIPCPSINPNRADALEELVRCHAKGARLLKIHPPTQGVDVGSKSEIHRIIVGKTGADGSPYIVVRKMA